MKFPPPPYPSIPGLTHIESPDELLKTVETWIEHARVLAFVDRLAAGRCCAYRVDAPPCVAILNFELSRTPNWELERVLAPDSQAVPEALRRPLINWCSIWGIEHALAVWPGDIA